MNILLGIGNPGRDYESTRHNIGHLLINELSNKYNTPLKPAKGDYLEANIEIEGERVKVVRSLVFMNNSGVVAKQLSALPDFLLKKFIVVLDDFALPLGRIKIRRGGSSGGHRGLESIIYALGSARFPRLRIGIGPVEDDAVDFVLSGFTAEEIDTITESIKRAIVAVEIFVKEGIEKAMNYANQSKSYNRAL